MKRKIGLILAVCLLLCGCGDKQSEELAEDLTEKISGNDFATEEPVMVIQEASEEDTADDLSTLSSNQTITIYDIEDGYLEVPYYPELPQCEYDWENLSVSGQLLSYHDPQYESVVGIDVSKFQGDIDWEKIKSTGIDFVIIRLGFRGYGNGALVTDERFEQNIKGAQQAGLDVGVYFLSQALDEIEAEEEAEYTLSEIKKYAVSPITYPVVVDSEKIKTGEARTVSMSNAEMTDAVIAYCDVVRSAGYTPAIYANSQWLTTRLDIRRLTDIDIWYADYQIVDNNEAPLYPYPFSIWQYSNHGKIDGIDGDVDLNICFRRKNGT